MDMQRKRNDKGELQCKTCLHWFALDLFGTTTHKRGIHVYSYPSANCKKCLYQSTKKWVQKNRDKVNAWNRNHRYQLREEFINEYGGQCSCCEERRREFLTLEHIHGRINKTQVHLELERLKNSGWPTADIQILCFNCNSAKGVYGSCPHTWEVDEHRAPLNTATRQKIYETTSAL
jgi:5-methylcytosine-specific restriction endonuclease McrA